jgi:hypothetical protein
MGHHLRMKLFRLDQVTLISVTSVDLPAAELAMMISMHDIDFSEVKLLTSEAFVPRDPKIKVVKIPTIDFLGYSRFVLNNLHEYVDTEFCLLVQADGFVLNANRWQNKFLEYDYIGAPWPNRLTLVGGGNDQIIEMPNQVGNGGFSLRSKKLLLETAKINFDKLTFPTKSEDLIICHFLYEEMLKKGINFPSPQYAARFSIESEDAFYGQTIQTAFGFHGRKLRDYIFKSILNDY